MDLPGEGRLLDTVMTDLQTYCRMFARLNRAPGAAWNDETKRRAPHKPFLLLAVIDLIARGSLKSRIIDIRGDLDELNELFTDYWRCIMPPAQKTSIAFPFSRLHNEPFWTLVTASGHPPSAAEINAVTTVTQLRRLANGAQLDTVLYVHLTNPPEREALAETLLQACFSGETQTTLRDVRSVHSEAFDYGQALEDIAHQRKDIRGLVAGATYRPAARDQGFRRAIIVNYDHRCALCGVRIVTPEGQTAVDAAHIVPWNVSHNDDVRNGMALCKLCHWAFDRGIMAVSNSFTVLLSRDISKATNAAGLLGVREGRNFVGPKDSQVWPLPKNLAWHRKEHDFH